MKPGPALLLFVVLSGVISFELRAQTTSLREPIHLDTSRYRISPPFKRQALLTEEEKDRLITPIRQSFDPEDNGIVISTTDATHRRAIPLLGRPLHKKPTRFEWS